MIKKSLPNNQGSITLLTIFLTSMFLLLFAFADYAMAIKEKVMTRNDVITEQAFYAANSCLEEGYLKLRTDASYDGDSLIPVGNALCNVEVDANGTNGTLEGTGIAKDKIRKIASIYKDAGPAGSQVKADIFHVLDRSLSTSYHCTDYHWNNNANECRSHGGVWSNMRPFDAIQAAAINFLSFLDDENNRIGVISYENNTTTEQILTIDFAQAENAIRNMNPPIGLTNIGAAIKEARYQLLLDPLPGVQKAMILMTDGKPTSFTNPDPAQYALDEAAIAKGNGILIITVGLGPDGSQINEALLKQIASREDLYFNAPTADDLEEVYNEIGNLLVSFGIKQGSWQEK